MWTTLLEWFVKLSPFFVALLLVYAIGRHGLPWVWGKITSMFSGAAADVTQLRTVLSADFSAIEARFRNLESHVGVTAPAGTTLVAPPKAPAAPAVAAPAA